MRIEYRNARMIDASGERMGTILVEEGKIRYAGPAAGQQSDTVVELAGRAVMPAFIDMHCHLRDPGYPEKETMQTGMRAALSGGFATICAMANTNPVTAAPAQVRANLEKARKLKLCKLIQAAAAGEALGDTIPTDYAALSKVTNVISNDGNTILSDAFMRQLLQASGTYGFVISTHCQPERAIVRRDLALLRAVGGNLHIGHISHRETLGMIRAAKAEGLPVTCEVMPHHLFGWDCDYRVNPPLRSRADAEALIEGIREGAIDCLATDHAPHTPADKAAGAAGISNFEYAAQIFLQVFHQHHIPLTRFAAMTSLHPARRLGLHAGLLAPGYPADLVVLDLEEESDILQESRFSKQHNTPFAGRRVRGRVLATIVEGKIRYEYR